MATPPLSSVLISNLAQATAWRFDSELGPIFTPRFFCCTDPNTLGLTDGKEPVAVIDLSPNPAFVGDTVNYDGSDSYDPDGSVVGYAWTFESHSPASGTAASGTLNYASAGTYTIQLIVRDGTNLRSTPAREELVVKAPEDSWFVAASNGVFYTGDGGQNWVEALGSVDARCVTVDPATNQYSIGSKTVWAALDGSIVVTNAGTSDWVAKNPGTVTNVWSDGTAPQPEDLTYIQVHFAGGKLFALANWQEPSGTLERSWLFYTTDFDAMRTDTSGSVTWAEIDY